MGNEEISKKKERRTLKKSIIFLMPIAAGIFLGWVFNDYFENLNGSFNELPGLEKHEVGYKFINPLLECEYGQENFAPIFHKPLEEIEDLVLDTINKKEVTEASVYFRDLNNGPWFAYNIDTKFTPASLLKVPLMIAYLKKAEDEPGLLDKKLTLEKANENAVPNIKDQEIKIGESYTIGELIELMIVYSDNNAADLLLHNIGDSYRKKIYSDLGIKLPIDDLAENFITVKEYASFFRILYNSSYLSRDMSEKALEILSRSNFDQGICAPLPKDLLVADKFGEREMKVGGKEVSQLHDCGIVYYPNRPYLLCVMTRGEDINKLRNIIEEISSIIYNERKAMNN